MERTNLVLDAKLLAGARKLTGQDLLGDRERGAGGTDPRTSRAGSGMKCDFDVIERFTALRVVRPG